MDLVLSSVVQSNPIFEINLCFLNQLSTIFFFLCWIAAAVPEKRVLELGKVSNVKVKLAKWLSYCSPEVSEAEDKISNKDPIKVAFWGVDMAFSRRLRSLGEPSTALNDKGGLDIFAVLQTFDHEVHNSWTRGCTRTKQPDLHVPWMNCISKSIFPPPRAIL